MKGFPKHLNSKEDYDYIREHFPYEKWAPYWRQLVDDRYRWMDTHVISNPAEGVTDKTHRVTSYNQENMETGVEETIYVQQEYKKNPGSDFWRMGFTLEEVEAALQKE